MIDATAQAAAPGMSRDQFMALIQQLIGQGNGAGQWAPGMPAPALTSRGVAGFSSLGAGGLSQLGAQLGAQTVNREGKSDADPFGYATRRNSFGEDWAADTPMGQATMAIINRFR